MDHATEFMALAAHYRRQARLEPAPPMRERLLKKAAQCDANACAIMLMASENT